MRATMPRPRKPYVQKETNHHGKTVWYFRKGDGARTRLQGEYESPEWRRDYEEALAAAQGEAAAVKTGNGTLGWLIDRYLDSLALAELAAGTQKARRSILKRVKEAGGNLPLRQVTRGTVVAGRDRRRDTPAAAVNFVKTADGRSQAGVYTRKARRGKRAGEAAKMLEKGQDENNLSPHLLSSAPHLKNSL